MRCVAILTMMLLQASKAFVTRSSHRATFSSSRRKRPPADPSKSFDFMDKLAKQGKITGYKHGAIWSVVEDSTSSVDNVDLTDDLFPLKGKSPEKAPPRLRFAPSPTGSLHVGGARTALYNWLMAKKGQLDNPNSESGFVLRVEDTDLARSTKESERSVLQDLKWLGLDWDEGPDMALAKYGPYRQSERSQLYKELADQLLEQGKAYRCFCTPEELEEMRAQQEAAGVPPRYDGTWRDASEEAIQERLAEGAPYTVRFKVPPGARVVIEDAVRGTVSWDAEATVGDFILLRSSGVPVYNFCVAVDDATMGITTVVRAEEHLTNTLRQGLILDALEAPRPKYAHCSLILGQDKQKLSKRHGATSCNQFKLDGFLPDAMINYLALLGWSDGSEEEIWEREDLIETFDINRVVKSPSVFDMDKLKWVNSQHLKKMPVEGELVELVKEQMQLEGLVKEETGGNDLEDVAFAATSLAKQMMETTKDAALNAKTVLQYNLPSTFDELTDKDAKRMIQNGNFYPLAMEIVKSVQEGTFPLPDPLQPLEAFMEKGGKGIVEDNQLGGTAYSYPQAYKAHMKNLAKHYNVKGKNLFHPIRLALTGEMSGQDVTKQLSLLHMASVPESVIDADAVGVVSFQDRMEQLQKFCDSIPQEFRAPQTETKKKEAKSDSKDTSTTSSATEATAVQDEPSDPLATFDGPPITALDIRVGQITKVWEHPDADKLYCEEIDVGEDEPRQVASGLRPYLKKEQMEHRKVLVLCNLKARKMLGFPSHGMVLCASNADHSEVQLVNPPVDAKIGERISFPNVQQEEPFGENKIGKKKVLEKLAPHLITNKYGVPEFMGRPFWTSAGVCTSSIPDGTVS